jgi:hypothetical protein
MTILKRLPLRGVAIIACCILVQMHVASSLAGAAGQGRNVSACVSSCNSISDLCRDACAVDCALLYPEGESRTRCMGICRDLCIDEMQSCKARCNVNRVPPSGVEP